MREQFLFSLIYVVILIIWKSGLGKCERNGNTVNSKETTIESSSGVTSIEKTNNLKENTIVSSSEDSAIDIIANDSKEITILSSSEVTGIDILANDSKETTIVSSSEVTATDKTNNLKETTIVSFSKVTAIDIIANDSKETTNVSSSEETAADKTNNSKENTVVSFSEVTAIDLIANDSKETAIVSSSEVTTANKTNNSKESTVVSSLEVTSIDIIANNLKETTIVSSSEVTATDKTNNSKETTIVSFSKVTANDIIANDSKETTIVSSLEVTATNKTNISKESTIVSSSEITAISIIANDPKETTIISSLEVTATDKTNISKESTIVSSSEVTSIDIIANDSKEITIVSSSEITANDIIASNSEETNIVSSSEVKAVNKIDNSKETTIVSSSEVKATNIINDSKETIIVNSSEVTDTDKINNSKASTTVSSSEVIAVDTINNSQETIIVNPSEVAATEKTNNSKESTILSSSEVRATDTTNNSQLRTSTTNATFNSSTTTNKKTVTYVDMTFFARKAERVNVKTIEEKGPPVGIYSNLVDVMLKRVPERPSSANKLNTSREERRSMSRTDWPDHHHHHRRKKSKGSNSSFEVAYVRPPPINITYHEISPEKLRQGKHSHKLNLRLPKGDNLDCEFCDLISSPVKRRAMKLSSKDERRLNGSAAKRPPWFRRDGSVEHKTKKEIDAMFLKPEFLSAYSIEKIMNQIVTDLPGINVTTEVIGKTLSYNDIVLLKFSQTNLLLRSGDSIYVDEPPQKKIVFIVHGLSTQGMTKLPCLSNPEYFQEYIQYYLNHLDKFDIFLLPMANPDGFGFAQNFDSADISWSKNLSPQTACSGVNLDRNFNVEWDHRVNISSCSQVYPGPQPFSEAESRAVRKIFHTYSQKMIAYINVHGGMDSVSTYKGDAVLYPKGYSDVATDEDKYLDIKGEIAETMKNASFKVVTVQVDSLYNWYGQVAGTSVDYASTVYGIPYAMEFVMQLYMNNYEDEELPRYDVLAHRQIWRRVIDVVFGNIYNRYKILEESRRVLLYNGSDIVIDYDKHLKWVHE